MLNFNFKDFFAIHDDREEQSKVIDQISANVSFRGANSWILVTAILIACLGLNMNSTAVIIGAMLISPLMGPITGMGLAIGINDLDLLKRATRNYMLTTVMSIITATVYFVLTPFKEVQPELIARTSPTIYDVLIAFIGGTGGIIALCIKDKGNVLPGVAIATALMPPLCTAGYGLASLNIEYFAGAIFLYFINSVFIALATLIGVRLMKFRHKVFVDKRRQTIVHRTIIMLVFLTMIPAGWMTLRIINKSYLNTQTETFVRDYLNWDGTQIIAHHLDGDSILRVVAVGKKVPDSLLKKADVQIKTFSVLKNYRIKLIQGAETDEIFSFKGVRMRNNIEEVQQLLQKESDENEELKKELEHYLKYEKISMDLKDEIKLFFPQIDTLHLAPSFVINPDSNYVRQMVIALVHTSKRIDAPELIKLKKWIIQKTQCTDVKVMVEHTESTEPRKR